MFLLFVHEGKNIAVQVCSISYIVDDGEQVRIYEKGDVNSYWEPYKNAVEIAEDINRALEFTTLVTGE